MKAIQITAPSEMKVVDIEKPVLEPGEVLVKIKPATSSRNHRIFG